MMYITSLRLIYFKTGSLSISDVQQSDSVMHSSMCCTVLSSSWASRCQLWVGGGCRCLHPGWGDISMRMTFKATRLDEIPRKSVSIAKRTEDQWALAQVLLWGQGERKEQKSEEERPVEEEENQGRMMSTKPTRLVRILAVRKPENTVSGWKK